MAVMTRY